MPDGTTYSEFKANTPSAYSADLLRYGDDWPQWQRELYPVTYVVDAGMVERKRAALTRELERDRRAMWWAMKQRDGRMVGALRRDVDRKARYVRNCETQLRLIAAVAARPFLSISRLGA